MAEEQQNSTKQEEAPVHENPIRAFFSNLLATINLPFPFPFTFPQKKANNSKKIEAVDVFSSKDEPIKSKPDAVSEEGDKPDLSSVTFPKRNEFDSLKLELEGGGRNTNPLLLWQVYVVGGFFIARWAYARWNERKGNAPPPPPPAENL